MHAVFTVRTAVHALLAFGAACSTLTAQPRSARSLPPVPVETYAAVARDEIGQAYRRALARPDDAEAVGALAMRLQAWEQFEPAAAAYARAQDLAPETVDWWYLGGLTASRLALPADAVAQFARAAALAPDRPLVTLRLADARLAAGDVEGAATLYRRLISTPACAAAAWYGLGRIHLAQKADAEARRAFTEALTLYPEFGAAHYAMAQIQRRAGDAEAARRSLTAQRHCLACAPTPDDPWQDRVALLRQDAAALLTRGIAYAAVGGTAGSVADSAAATAEAIRLHEAVLDTDQTRGQAHVNLITLYGRTGNAAAAHQHYLAALEEPGFAADAHRAYGAVLLSGQRADEALALFSQAAALTPGDAEVLQGMGLALEIVNRPADAAAAYTDALRVSPTSRTARFGLARVLVRLQRLDEAIAHLETLREPRDADTPRYLFALSVAYVNRGRLDEAIAAATDALDLARHFGDERTAASIEAELRKLAPAP
jgi:tetratricopeptide (TPR) repeat protein